MSNGFRNGLGGDCEVHSTMEAFCFAVQTERYLNEVDGCRMCGMKMVMIMRADVSRRRMAA